MFPSGQLTPLSYPSIHQIRAGANSGACPLYPGPSARTKGECHEHRCTAGDPVPDPEQGQPQETTYAGKLSDWERILTSIEANAADLSHLATPRAQLAALLAQVKEIKQQQSASRATKETASLQIQSALVDGQRLAALLRQAVRQHYGPRSPKLAEFSLKVFRGRAKSATSTPEAPPPVEIASTAAEAVVKSPSAPTPHS